MTTTPGAERARAYRARKVAAGYRILHGVPTLTPRTWRVGVPPAHGTASRYTSKRYPCRCDACLAARREYLQTRRAARNLLR